MTPRPALTLGSLTECIRPFGLNLVGAITAEAFDRTQPSERRVRTLAPGCGTVVVIGSGGREFWERLELDARRPWSSFVAYRPVEERCALASRQATAWLASRGVSALAVSPRQQPMLNFPQLAEMAGLGVVSPVSNWLLNPQYGPWLTVNFALLVDSLPFGSGFPRAIAGEYQPCAGCHQPCVRACPAGACGGGSFDREVCGSWYHGGGCASGCDMKRACPQGAAHRFGAVEERLRHAEASADLVRDLGLGGWRRFMPRGLLGRP